MSNLFLFFLGPTVFFIIKLANFGIRFSDTNLYFYTAWQLLQGKLLYRDIFFTNLPLFPYWSTIYYFLIGKRLDWYFLTPTIEVIISSLIIAYLSFQKTKKYLLALFSQLIYLFSFIMLTTSDHQTGVFFASLLSLLAYYFYQKKNYYLSGVFLALMVLAKAYYLPIALAFFIDSFQNKKNFLKMISFFLIVFFLILGPFILFTGRDFFNNVIFYSLLRPAGLNKINIIWFFIKHDLVFFFLFLLSLFNFKNNRLLSLISLFSFVFLVFYQDFYYLYLNLLIPFLALSFTDLNLLFEKFNSFQLILYLIISAFLIFNFFIYTSRFVDLQKINNLKDLVSTVKKEKPKFLYGAMPVAPAIAYLTKTPLLEGIIDTNENLFYKKVLNRDILTKKALINKTMIVASGIYYPQLNINQPAVDVIYNQEKIIKQCQLIISTPIKTEGIINRINLFKCLSTDF